MLVAMTSWKQTGHVITLISQWLTDSLEEGLGLGRDREVVVPKLRQNHARKKGKKVRGGRLQGGEGVGSSSVWLWGHVHMYSLLMRANYM